jgi:phosphate transport system substrate-binding protein
VEFAYAKQNRLNHVRLKNSSGKFVEPGFDSFQAAAASGDFDPKKHFYLWLTNASGRDAWPIAGATFILLAREKRESNIKTVRFFDWAFKKGDKVARRLVYVPLPESLKNKIRQYWKGLGIY